MIKTHLDNPVSRLVRFWGQVNMSIIGQVPQVWTFSDLSKPAAPYTPPGQSSPLNVWITDPTTGDYYFYANVPKGVSVWFVAYNSQPLDGVVINVP